jgi:hypothetical protein
MRNRVLFALVCLCCFIFTAALAELDPPAQQIVRVPGDVATLPEALAIVQPGDIIEMAPGHHAVVGRNLPLKAGLTIRVDPKGVGRSILHEVAAFAGDWRDQPVFVLDQTGEPCRLEGLEFHQWRLSDSPYETISNPIIYVASGELQVNDCHWLDCYKQDIYFAGGRGLFQNCGFEYGAGYPSAIAFHGDELVLDQCWFDHNRWINDCTGLHGSVLRLAAGKTRIVDCDFNENGPLMSVLIIDCGATLHADRTCLGCNEAVYEAQLAGCAYLNCCSVHPGDWLIEDGGVFVNLNPVIEDKAMAHEAMSWSQVKSVFD